MVDSKQQWKAWLYLAPAIILLLIFTVWPIFSTIRMAFINGYDYTYLAENTKDEKIITIGIRNFATVRIKGAKSISFHITIKTQIFF